MNGIQGYIDQVSKVCGQQISFRVSNNQSASPISGAFASDHFTTFKKNFLNRVRRLFKAYGGQEEYRKVLIDKIKNAGLKRNWAGAFAELSAYDYLNFSEYSLLNPVVINNCPGTTTLAQYLGRGRKADLDCYFNNFDVYADIKILADNVRLLLDGIYGDLRKEVGRSDFHITEDRDLDLEPTLIEHKRRELLNELVNEVRGSSRPSIIKSITVPQITFRFHWEPGTHVSIRFYDPYRHAETHYKLAFNYPEKYVEDKPFLLIYVIFPWFNGVINNFNNSNKIFYRSFSRRVFFQHKHDETQYKTLRPDFNSNLTIYSVSKKLSGLIFLEDHSITLSAIRKPSKQYSAFVYLNPSSDNPVVRSSFLNFLFSLPRIEIDDFMYDNY